MKYYIAARRVAVIVKTGTGGGGLRVRFPGGS